MRRKLYVLLLVLTSFTLLYGCGKSKTEKVEEALQGSWRTSTEEVLGVQYGIDFNNGRFEFLMCLGENSSVLNDGTYEIGDETLTLKFEQGEQGETLIDYTFDNDILTISNETFGQFHNMNE